MKGGQGTTLALPEGVWVVYCFGRRLILDCCTAFWLAKFGKLEIGVIWTHYLLNVLSDGVIASSFGNPRYRIPWNVVLEWLRFLTVCSSSRGHTEAHQLLLTVKQARIWLQGLGQNGAKQARVPTDSLQPE